MQIKVATFLLPFQCEIENSLDQLLTNSVWMSPSRITSGKEKEEGRTL